MKLIGQDKKVGDLVKHKSPLEVKRLIGIVLRKNGDRIYVVHNDGSCRWADDWHYWKIIK